MRILWITNVIFPKLAKELGYAETSLGGWMYSAADILCENKDIQLAVATVYNGTEIKQYTIDNILYYLLPVKKHITIYDKSLEAYWREIKQEFCPNVIHLYGTELPHGLAYLKACGNENVVVSLQGIVNIYSRYYYGNIYWLDILRNPILIYQKKSFDKSNRNEIEIIKKAQYFEGRSDWDKCIVWSINPMSKYYHCDRTLRSIFYTKSWSLDRCNKYTIFLSQSSSPIKGIHQLIKALPYILREYPDVKVYISGDNMFDNRNIKDKVKYLGYGKYVSTLMKKYNLKNKIIFTGSLSETEICEMYLKSHVFICPSSIENVPNSLGEAQILGVPCIASYVGGNAGLIEHGISGFLYRFEEYEMLAKYVCDIFGNDSLAKNISYHGSIQAKGRHNPEKNYKQLINIYSDIY